MPIITGKNQPPGAGDDTPALVAAIGPGGGWATNGGATFAVGVGRVGEGQSSGDCCSTDYGKMLGIANIPGTNFPRFNYDGGLVPVTRVGASGAGLRWVAFQNSDFTLNFTRIRGSHSVKLGFE